VTDSLGNPVADADVVLQTATGAPAGTTKADAGGLFSVQDVALGTYAIVVTATGLTSASSIATTNPGTESSVTAALPKSDAIDVRVSPQRLNHARNGLSPETGSSVHRLPTRTSATCRKATRRRSTRSCCKRPASRTIHTAWSTCEANTQTCNTATVGLIRMF
jgi:hypothetical protein